MTDKSTRRFNFRRPFDFRSLSKPNAVWALVQSGYGGTVIEAVQAMTPKRQATVLSVPSAALSLAYEGEAGAGAVVEMLKAMTPKQQAAVLSQSSAVESLAEKGEAGAVVEMLKEMAPEQQAAVLSAFGATAGLMDNGYAEAAKELKASSKGAPAVVPHGRRRAGSSKPAPLPA